MRKRLLLSLLLIVLSIFSYGQLVFPENATTYISQLEKYDKFMGVIAVSKNGQIELNEGAGYADLDHRVEMLPDTKFRIGSITKMFTSVLVLKAVEENKLRLDDKLSLYLPQIPNADSITIELMLRHRSGIFSVTSEPDFFEWCVKPKTRTELVDIILRNPPVFQPDVKAEYSNSNYILLTFILEDLYQKKYHELLSEKITQPLGLTNTSVGKKINAPENEAYSYRYNGKWEIEAETDMSVPQGAGMIVSTASDLITFIEALFEGKLITKENLDKMTEIKDRFGLGIFMFPFEGKQSFGHAGGIDGFTSMLVHYPEENVTFCFLSNGLNIHKNTISIAILSYAFGLRYEAPSFSTVKVETSILDTYTGEYTSEEFPRNLQVIQKDGQLMAQFADQEAFPLDAFDNTTFRNDQMGLQLVFNSQQNMLILNKGGRNFPFKKFTGR